MLLQRIAYNFLSDYKTDIKNFVLHIYILMAHLIFFPRLQKYSHGTQ
jgi:hypothetical protein